MELTDTQIQFYEAWDVLDLAKGVAAGDMKDLERISLAMMFRGEKIGRKGHADEVRGAWTNFMESLK